MSLVLEEFVAVGDEQFHGLPLLGQFLDCRQVPHVVRRPHEGGSEHH